MTTEIPPLPPEKPSRWRFNWVLPALFKPRRTFHKIITETAGTWLTPMLIFTVFALLQIYFSGQIKQQAALMGGPILPPDFQYYTEEDQARFLQAAQATQSPVFFFVMPGILQLASVWIGWLLVGGLLHLVLTLLGGRGDTSLTMKIVAWGSLPLALRAAVRTIYLWQTKLVITSPGLSGFAPQGEEWWKIFATKLLENLDIYLVWHIILLAVGVLIAMRLSRGKVVGGILFTLLFVLLVQAGVAFGVSKISNLTVIRPFFF